VQKNVSGQKLIVFAFDSTTNLPKAGDAANITAYVSLDYGTVTVLGDTSATEMDATNAKGYYLFDLTQGETNGNTLLFSAKSSTSNIVVIGCPATVFTDPANFAALAITSGGIAQADIQTIKTQAVTCAAPVTVLASVGTAATSTAQTGDSFARIGSTGSGLTSLAPASTALSTAQWTNTLATNLGTLAGHDPGGTLASQTNITAGTITTVTTVTNQLTAAQIATGVWQDATAGDFTTAGSIGKGLFTSGTAPGAASGLALVGSNMGTVSSVTGSVNSVATAVTLPSIPNNWITAAGIASGALTAAVWDTSISGHTTSGTFGGALNAAGSVGDPMSATVPGSYASGTAGYAIGTYLDAAISSRLKPADTLARVTLVDTVTTNSDMRGTNGAALASVWTATLATHLDAIYAKLPTNAIADETLLLAAIGSPQQAGSAITLPAIPNDWITAAGIADGAIDTATFAAGTTVPRVTLVDTTTANTDMRGTDGAALASVWTATLATHLDAIYAKLPANNIADETLVISATNAILAAIGTPAQAGTALSTAQWTNALASAIGTLAGHDPGGTLASSADAAALASGIGAVQADTDDIQSRLPAALVAGKMSATAALDLTQVLGDVQADGTLGAAMVAAEAQGVGNWVIDTIAKTLTIYRRNGTTVVRTFDLDSVTAPTSRT
jgi:hypothetical protein